MSFVDGLEIAVLVVPVVGLIGLGMALTLRSGVARLPAGGGPRPLLGNFWSTLFSVAAMLAALRVAQRLAGLPIWAGW